MHAAASLAEPISDTLKYADTAFFVTGSVDRHQLYAMQTPQIFERRLIEDAYRAVYEENTSVTDEVSAVERLGHKIVLVPNKDSEFQNHLSARLGACRIRSEATVALKVWREHDQGFVGLLRFA